MMDLIFHSEGVRIPTTPDGRIAMLRNEYPIGSVENTQPLWHCSFVEPKGGVVPLYYSGQNFEPLYRLEANLFVTPSPYRYGLPGVVHFFLPVDGEFQQVFPSLTVAMSLFEDGETETFFRDLGLLAERTPGSAGLMRLPDNWALDHPDTTGTSAPREGSSGSRLSDPAWARLNSLSRLFAHHSPRQLEPRMIEFDARRARTGKQIERVVRRPGSRTLSSMSPVETPDTMGLMLLERGLLSAHETLLRCPESKTSGLASGLRLELEESLRVVVRSGQLASDVTGSTSQPSPISRDPMIRSFQRELQNLLETGRDVQDDAATTDPRSDERSPIERSPVLYERWCAITIIRFLFGIGFTSKARTNTKFFHRLLTTQRNPLHQGTCLNLKNEVGVTLEVFVEPLLDHPSKEQEKSEERTPDLLIRATFPNGQKDSWLFDFKYRPLSPRDGLHPYREEDLEKIIRDMEQTYRSAETLTVTKSIIVVHPCLDPHFSDGLVQHTAGTRKGVWDHQPDPFPRIAKNEPRFSLMAIPMTPSLSILMLRRLFFVLGNLRSRDTSLCWACGNKTAWEKAVQTKDGKKVFGWNLKCKGPECGITFRYESPDQASELQVDGHEYSFFERPFRDDENEISD